MSALFFFEHELNELWTKSKDKKQRNSSDVST